MAIGKQLSKILFDKNIRIDDVARHLGVTKQAVSRWKNDHADPTAEKLVQLASFLGVSVGSLFEDSVPIDTCVPEEENPPSGVVAIPEVEFKVGAGDGPEDWREIPAARKRWYCTDFFYNRGLKSERCVRTKVKGDSMEPTIHDKDRVLFYLEDNMTLQDIDDGRIYVVAIDGKMRVKRLSAGRDYLIVNSDNPEYKQEIFRKEELNHIKIYGPVLEITRTL